MSAQILLGNRHTVPSPRSPVRFPFAGKQGEDVVGKVKTNHGRLARAPDSTPLNLSYH